MKIKAISFLLILVSLCFMSGIDDKPGSFEKHLFIRHHDTLPYRLLKPLLQEKQVKYPLVIFLHGSGERGKDNEKQLVHGVDLFADSIAQYPCFLIAPQCPEGHRWVEYDWTSPAPVQPEKISAPLSQVVLLIKDMVKHYPIDKDRIYVTGLSMGGKGTLDLLARYPKMFAAAIPVCGGADVKTAPRIKAIPIWTFHGDQDPVVPFVATDNLVKAIRAAGGNPEFTVLPGVGHNAWDYAYKEPGLLKWLFAKSKPVNMVQ